MLKMRAASTAMIFFALGGMVGAAPAWAIPMSSAFTQVPSRFMTTDLTAGSRALGEICLSRDVMPDGTVCNPALLPYDPESTLLGRIYVGNGYTAYSTANNLVYQPISQDFLKGLFQNQNATSFEANVGLVFVSKYFSAAFEPYRVQFFSEVQNPTQPVMAVHAAVERSFTLEGGVPLDFISPKLRDFSAGVKTRILERRYVHSEFSFDDAAATTDQQTLQSLVPVQTQHALWMDPSVAWVPRQAPWHLMFSVSGENLGFVSNQDPLYYEPADMGVGIGVEPPVGFGRLRFGLDAVNLVNGDSLSSRLRAGSSYKFGIIEAMVGANQDAFAGGLQFSLEILQVGIVYEFTRDDFDGTAPESKISTEFAVRL